MGFITNINYTISVFSRYIIFIRDVLGDNFVKITYKLFGQVKWFLHWIYT